MENASKALLIAGGVLIAILIISLLVLTVNQISNFNKEKEETLATEQVLKFNQGYEAYNKYNILGTEIITVFNKAIDNNSKQGLNAKGYDVEVKLTLLKDTIIAKNEAKVMPVMVIQRAGDDAAGLAISEKMRSQIRGLTTAAEYGDTITTLTYSNKIQDFLKARENTDKRYYCDEIVYGKEDGRIKIISFKEMTKEQIALVSTVKENMTSAERIIRNTGIAEEMIKY